MKRFCTFLVLLASACAYGQVGPIAITSAECATIGVGAKVSVITFQVTGTWTGTLQPKITVQGQAAANVQVTPSTSSTAASTVTANGIYTAQVNGADTFQVCGNTVASGTANVYLNTSVASKGGGASSGGSGTVTSVTFTGDGVVDSSTPSTAVTASGTVAATIKTQTAHTFLGNSTGSTAAPTFASLALADLPGTVVNATSPGAGIAHFAGSTQTVTSSAIVAADITSGTITGTQLSSSTALPNGVTATTQSASDNSTKVATTAYVDRAAPAIVQLETHAASTSASLNFTTCLGTAGYSRFRVEVLNLRPATNGARLELLFSTNGGSSYDSSAIYGYSSFRTNSGGTAVGGASTQTQAIIDDGSTTDNTANFGIDATYNITPGGATAYTRMQSLSYSVEGSGAFFETGLSHALYASNTATNAFKIFFDSGNITTGTINCYGITP